MPKSVVDAEREYLAALEHLLRSAVAVGDKEPGAIVKAKRARQSYNATVAELRNAERHRGRISSINWISSKLGIARHSEAARGPSNSVDYVTELNTALADLEKATW